MASKIAAPQTKEQNGKPLDPNAFVVIPDVRKYPNLATATFNVRVRDNGDSVSITVNMHDIKASYTKNNGFLIYTEPIVCIIGIGAEVLGMLTGGRRR